jgi:transposase
MKAPLFVRALSPVEQTKIEAGLRSSDAFTLRRCQILLASSRGQRPATIARNLGCATQTVRNALHAFEQKGLDCLKQESSRPKTVQAQFDQVRCEELRAILHKLPHAFGKMTSLWTLQLAAEVCFEQGLTEQQVSIETIRQALKRLDVRWQRAKHWITSVRRVGAYEISVKHGRGREQRPLGQELTRSRKAKVDRSMLKKRKAEEGMYSVDSQVLCA